MGLGSLAPPFLSGIATDIGGREVNQDCAAEYPETGVFCVADGVGGLPHGELAAALAVEAVSERQRELAESGDPMGAIAAIFSDAHARIREVSESLGRSMGTTLTVFHLREGRCVVGHVGDTRLFVVRKGKVLQVTRDHTVAQMKGGENLKAHAHGLTRAVGYGTDLKADVTTRACKARDVFVVCTDGLWASVSPRDIVNAARRAPARGAELLRQTAVESGATDNCTVLVARQA